MDARPADLKPVPVLNAAQVEFTVHYEPRIKGYLQVQTLSLLELLSGRAFFRQA